MQKFCICYPICVSILANLFCPSSDLLNIAAKEPTANIKAPIPVANIATLKDLKLLITVPSVPLRLLNLQPHYGQIYSSLNIPNPCRNSILNLILQLISISHDIKVDILCDFESAFHGRRIWNEIKICQKINYFKIITLLIGINKTLNLFIVIRIDLCFSLAF